MNNKIELTDKIFSANARSTNEAVRKLAEHITTEQAQAIHDHNARLDCQLCFGADTQIGDYCRSCYNFINK